MVTVDELCKRATVSLSFLNKGMGHCLSYQKKIIKTSL